MLSIIGFIDCTCRGIQRIELPLFISIPAGRIKRKLFHSMLPELTTWHIVRYIKRCFIYYFAKHNSWLCQGIVLNICLNINLHKPDADEI